MQGCRRLAEAEPPRTGVLQLLDIRQHFTRLSCALPHKVRADLAGYASQGTVAMDAAMSPGFGPACQQDKAVRVRVSTPVRFALEQGEAARAEE
jgi:hypothetical protein